MTARSCTLVALALLTSCATAVPGPPATEPPLPPGGVPWIQCLFPGSSAWKAWTNHSYGPDQQSALHITGKVALYYPSWGPAFPIMLRTVKGDPTHAVIDLAGVYMVPSPDHPNSRDMSGDWPISGPIRSVTVTCAGKTFATIRHVSGR